MIVSVCPVCWNMKCKPDCAFKNINWRAPMLDLQSALNMELGSNQTVVDSPDGFGLGAYDLGWDLQ